MDRLHRSDVKQMRDMWDALNGQGKDLRYKLGAVASYTMSVTGVHTVPEKTVRLLWWKLPDRVRTFFLLTEIGALTTYPNLRNVEVPAITVEQLLEAVKIRDGEASPHVA